MGASSSDGVVNPQGQVFNTRQGGSNTYPGLYVMDGSVMPGPIAVNPTLTIVAMSLKIAASAKAFLKTARPELCAWGLGWGTKARWSWRCSDRTRGWRDAHARAHSRHGFNRRAVTLLDADIDGNGKLMAHLGDLFKHRFSGGTHPYDIHEYLVLDDKARPLGYDLV
jgi:GMC oxidoreductase